MCKGSADTGNAVVCSSAPRGSVVANETWAIRIANNSTKNTLNTAIILKAADQGYSTSQKVDRQGSPSSEKDEARRWMKAVAIMTPDPKNLANVNAISGTWSRGSFLAQRGNKTPEMSLEQRILGRELPKELVTKITKMAAICKPKRPSKSLPPPQIGE